MEMEDSVIRDILKREKKRNKKAATFNVMWGVVVAVGMVTLSWLTCRMVAQCDFSRVSGLAGSK